MDGCGRTSAPSRPSTTRSPPSTRPSDARGRRSSAFVRERYAPMDPRSRTIAVEVGWLRPIRSSHREACMAFTLKINGTPHEVDVDGDIPLLWVLRDVLGMTGTKFGCGQALCGACTVHLDGQPIRSCQTPVDSVGNSAITTIEEIGQTPQGAALQKAWLELEVVQCGYCQSGQIMSAAALLKDTPKPSRAEILEHMSTNICRCGTYPRIVRAIERAAREG